MNDVCFELNALSMIPSSCIEAENKIQESIRALDEITCKTETEIADFIAHENNIIASIQNSISNVAGLIATADKKSIDAQNQKCQTLPPPAKPLIPSNASQNDKEAISNAYQKQAAQIEEQNARICEKNHRIDNYVSQCAAAKSELEDILSKLYQLEASVRSEMETTTARTREFLSTLHNFSNSNKKVNATMSEFCFVFDHLYETAQELYMMRPSNLREYSYVTRLFQIKNTHHHNATSSAFFGKSVNDANAVSANSSESFDSACDEVLLKERDEASFFEKAEAITRFRMPSANLHKLGGKTFLAKMSDKGFVTVPQPDGATIDVNGMIHWEKKDG
ncbi:MAG: hypothetical protein E7624_05160 [Ruminococcaceae bacterium]|nr:hypothetical protein [Oscillospiraceae bacterium]